MGGDAFDNTNRLSEVDLVETFNKIKTHVDGDEKLKGKVLIGMPPELRCKESFGDLDIHYTFSEGVGEVEESELKDILLEKVVKGLEVDNTDGKGVLKLSKCETSVLTKKRFQVDLHSYSLERFPLSLAVKGNGDFCWLLNLSLKKLDLKLNEEGLFIKKEGFSPELLSDLFLTDNLEEIRQLFSFKEGVFDGKSRLTKEEAFVALQDMDVFCDSAIKRYLDVDNSDSRRRKAKRTMIYEFAQWLVENPSTKTPLLKEKIQKQALETFHKVEDLQNAIDKAKFQANEHKCKHECKQYMNGNILKELYPTMSGPEIGETLTNLRNKSGGSWQSYHSFLSSTTKEEIETIISQIVKK